MEVKCFILISLFSFFFYFFIFNRRKKISLALGTMDIPKNNRQIHKIPVPLTGAYSVLVVLILILLNNLLFNFFHSDYNLIIISSIFAFFLGLFDDKLDLRPYIKIFFLSLIYLVVSSFSANLIIFKFYSSTYDTFVHLNEFSIIFSLLCILLLTNSLNLADGINGAALGIIFFSLLYITRIYNSEFNVYVFLILANLILIFFHNYNNKHFLGNSGTLMLSTFAGLLVIKLVNDNLSDPSSTNNSEQIFLIFLLPGIDMLRVFLERIIKNKNAFKADANHMHHLLIKNYSLKKSLLIYFSISNFPILLYFYFNTKIIIFIFFKILIYIFTVFYLKNKN
jgi:UDP-GlcNAc:undecaprenyl-phosphate GlcNAc-1-phosphate transferase